MTCYEKLARLAEEEAKNTAIRAYIRLPKNNVWSYIG